MLPVSIVIASFYGVLNGDQLLGMTHASEYPFQYSFWLIDNIKSHWMVQQVDPTMVSTMRHGRTGLCFFTLSLYLLSISTMIFLPKTISISERAAEEKGEANESAFTPTPWLRVSVICTSIFLAFFCVLIIEFSFWPSFANNIWYIQIAFEFLGPIVGLALNRVIDDRLLMAPLHCAFNVTLCVVMLSAPDFQAFIVARYLNFGLVFVHRVYFDHVMNAIVDTCNDAYKWTLLLMRSMKRFLWFYLGKKPVAKTKKQLEEEEEAAREKEEKDAARAALEKNRKEVETVEPVVEYVMDYSMETLSFFFQPLLILLMIIFRDESQLPENFEIRHQDLEYYFYFFSIFLGFQLVSDVFTLHAIELFKGWKLYDYFVYCRYRYIQREQRWKGLEHNLDECIEESLRSLDQMCFSSQYYFMCSLQAMGILSMVFSIEIMVRDCIYLFISISMYIYLYRFAINTIFLETLP